MKEQVGMLFRQGDLYTNNPHLQQAEITVTDDFRILSASESSKFCPSNTEVAILDTILSANGARQRAGENYFCSTNHMCDTVQGKK